MPPYRRKSSAPIAAASTRPAPIISTPPGCAPVGAVPAIAMAEGAGDASDGDGLADVAGAEVAAAAELGAAVATGATAGVVVRLVMMLAVHDTFDPPTFPVPLHWVILIGIARLILDPRSTEQSTAPPPPLPEPLHWVTIAPVAGEGLHPATPPPPFAEPTHWVTLGAVMGCARGVSRLMLFVMLTLQLIACAASLSELLHCRTAVTRLVEDVVNVPFGVEHGPRVQSRVTVVVECVLVPLTVLTTVTVHLSAVVAPSAPGPWPLHWSTIIVAASAAVGRAARSTIEKTPVSIISATTMTRQAVRGAGLGDGGLEVGVLGEWIVPVLM
jgi:hypothetical protein